MISDPVHKIGPEMLRSHGFEVTEAPEIDANELLSIIQEFEALVVRGRTKVTADLVEKGLRLTLVARAGAGLDNIDLQACQRKNVSVISTAEAPTWSVAELTVGLILAVLRQVAFADRSIKEGKWLKHEIVGSELRTRKVGILGISGRIGSLVGSMLTRGFGSEVHGYDIVNLMETCRKLGAEPHEKLESMLSVCDVVTVHVPYSRGTHHLLSTREFSLMKPRSILVNTSRGNVVDGPALLEALKTGRLGGAGLDVYSREPPVDLWEKELTSLRNVVCTPHVGGQTEECQRAESRSVAEQIISFFSSR